MSAPGDVRAACAAVLQSMLGLDWSVSSTWRAKPEPPQLDMMFGQTSYNTAMQGGNHDVSLIVRATAAPGEDSAYQVNLDPIIDWDGLPSTSLKAALEYDRTWGGTISACRVESVSEMKMYPTEGGALPGYEFTVQVTPNG